MTWFTFSLLSIFALAIAELTQQHLLNQKDSFSERTSAVFTFIFQSLLTIPVLFILNLESEFFTIFQPQLLPKIILVTILASIAMIFYFKSFRVKNISFSTIFISFSTVVSTILGIIFFSESTSPLKFLGIGLILGAIVVVNYKNAALEKNHFFGLIAGTLFGVSYTLDKGILVYLHPLIYLFWVFLLVAIFGTVLGFKDVKSSLRNKKFSAYKPLLISGLGYFFYNLFTFSAYKIGGEVGRIDAINNSQVFLIILFEFIVLKHTKGSFQKIFSAILVVIGIWILASVK
jgi:drug/metabolite transporter (DMT)-like permease